MKGDSDRLTYIVRQSYDALMMIKLSIHFKPAESCLMVKSIDITTTMLTLALMKVVDTLPFFFQV